MSEEPYVPGYASAYGRGAAHFPPSVSQPLSSVMTVQLSPCPYIEVSRPRTAVTLALVSPSIFLQSQLTDIHRGIDCDIQMTFSDIPYPDDALGPLFEIGVVVVCRGDIVDWIARSETRVRGGDGLVSGFDDMTLEIVRGPTMGMDEAGECWVVSMVLT
ncbi:hypothetical protein DRE_01222 [Drechslerella stenobrocha 248]|uniref:Uncharacterized protein n=1 Tax=Drechslerella stenobrocha 248 TaxID=1043628 RepID=W7HK58_9PEZI|nr:hypothetical protein DRE_01222 [Drechslerella stenobrocha 248]